MEQKINKNDIKRILIIRYKTFGDVFISTSIFETLKKHIPEAKIYYLVQEPYHLVALNHPFLDEIITFKKVNGIDYLLSRLKLILHIRRFNFDLVIDYQNNPGTRQISFLSGAKYRIGNNYGTFHKLNNYLIEEPQNRYSGSLKFDMLEPLGINEDKWKFHFNIDDNSQKYIDEWLVNKNITHKNFIVITPGSAVEEKVWRLKYFSELGDMIHTKFGLPIVLLYAPSELHYCQIVSEHMKYKPILSEELDIVRAVALVKRAKLLICNDSAINHISCATQTDTIAIFGNTDVEKAHKKLNPKKWSPHSIFPNHHLLYSGDIPSKDDSFGITPINVINKINEIF